MTLLRLPEGPILQVVVEGGRMRFVGAPGVAPSTLLRVLIKCADQVGDAIGKSEDVSMASGNRLVSLNQESVDAAELALAVSSGVVKRG